MQTVSDRTRERKISIFLSCTGTGEDNYICSCRECVSEEEEVITQVSLSLYFVRHEQTGSLSVAEEAGGGICLVDDDRGRGMR